MLQHHVEIDWEFFEKKMVKNIANEQCISFETFNEKKKTRNHLKCIFSLSVRCFHTITIVVCVLMKCEIKSERKSYKLNETALKMN